MNSTLHAPVWNDGSHAATGYQGPMSDHVVRGLALATQLPQSLVDDFFQRIDAYAASVRLQVDRLPGSQLLVAVTGHLVAVVDVPGSRGRSRDGDRHFRGRWVGGEVR